MGASGRLLAAALGLALLGACSGGPATVASCPPGAAVATVATGYILGPGDQLRLTVFRHPDLSGRFVLDGEGQLALPLVGEVDAQGLTTRELERLVAQRLRDGGFLVTPAVSIEVLDYRPFYVLGEVARPGSYPYQNGITVTNAVALAGGYTYRASRNGAVLQRGDCVMPAAAGMPILPGEILTVPERFF